MTTEPIRTLLVDDEVHGRVAVREHLQADARFEVIAEAAGGALAIDRVRELQPDLMFLDIQMPEVDGFDVLSELGADAPAVVMVTAFDQHAVRAFEHHALDYVLKPIDPERFAGTLERSVERVNERRAGHRDEAQGGLLHDLSPSNSTPDRLIFRAPGRLLCLRPDELRWVESAGNYVKLHVDSDTYLIRDTMTELANRLQSSQFVRIHRSSIVNVSEVREVRADRQSGESVAILRDGTELPIGRGNRDVLIEAIEGS
ncbi:MAG: LytR/AlgR family response regulator transcription factor [Phycisphaerales bacterium]